MVGESLYAKWIIPAGFPCSCCSEARLLGFPSPLLMNHSKERPWAWLDVVTQVCDASTWRWREEDQEFKAILGHKFRPV